jgi:hypothetical protein
LTKKSEDGDDDDDDDDDDDIDDDDGDEKASRLQKIVSRYIQLRCVVTHLGQLALLGRALPRLLLRQHLLLRLSSDDEWQRVTTNDAYGGFPPWPPFSRIAARYAGSGFRNHSR